jgi:hypothetical protein
MIETLNERLKDCEIQIKNGDSKQLRIIQLENSILQQQKAAAREIGKLRVAHRNEMQSIDVQMSMLRREADQRASAIKESLKLKRDLSSYRNNVKLARFKSAEIRAETAVKEVERLRTTLDTTTHHLKKSRMKCNLQKEKIVKMKIEYNKLFKLAERSDRGSGGSGGSGGVEDGGMKTMNRESIRDLANKNIHYADFYKKKLETSKTEVKALKGITRRWMMSDHKKTAELRVTREATKRYAIEVSDLEMKVNARQKNTSNARSKSGVLSDGVSGISISEKENKLNNEKQPSLATSSSVNVAADISSLEHTNDVRDILLRANLGKNWFSY